MSSLAQRRQSPALGRLLLTTHIEGRAWVLYIPAAVWPPARRGWRGQGLHAESLSAQTSLQCVLSAALACPPSGSLLLALQQQCPSKSDNICSHIMMMCFNDDMQLLCAITRQGFVPATCRSRLHTHTSCIFACLQFTGSHTTGISWA